MQGLTHRAIKLRGVGRLEHDAEIIAVGPVPLAAKLRLHTLIEARARKWIGERDSDIIRLRVANQRNGLLQFSPSFARIAELQEVAGANSGLLQPCPRGDHG